MKDRNIKHSDNWETPKSLYDELNKEFHFDFDPCPINHGEITEENDGLLIDWGSCNFVNPPYSRKLKEAFIKRAIELTKEGKTSVCLIPVSTSTKLFHEYILPNASDIRFLKGRVKFIGFNTKGEKVTDKCGMHDSMIVVFTKSTTTPDHWAESVKMADEMGQTIIYENEKYSCESYGEWLGPFSLPELHEKLISLRESEVKT